jgi:DDE superfamily endonuclease
MLLTPIPWAKRTWALPFLTCLAPSERFYEKKVRTHKKLTDWARQMVMQLRRWLPERQLVTLAPAASAGVVADSSFAVILRLFELSQLPGQICLIVRFRFAKRAALYEPPPPHKPHQRGAPPKKGQRLPTLEQVAQDTKTKWKRMTIPDWYGEGRRVVEIVSDTAVWYHSGQPPLPIRWVLIRDPKGKFKTQALLSTDLNVKPVQTPALAAGASVIKWFVLRWQLEVTYHEVREHLGVETQRQWSDLAILRTTPALLGLFSLVTLMAHQHAKRRKLPIRQTAWYHKTQPTFSDALALVRRQIWQHECFPSVASPTGHSKMPATVQNRLLSAVCYTP